jgi:hypothetical protein
MEGDIMDWKILIGSSLMIGAMIGGLIYAILYATTWAPPPEHEHKCTHNHIPGYPCVCDCGYIFPWTGAYPVMPMRLYSDYDRSR